MKGSFRRSGGRGVRGCGDLGIAKFGTFQRREVRSNAHADFRLEYETRRPGYRTSAWAPKRARWGRGCVGRGPRRSASGTIRGPRCEGIWWAGRHSEHETTGHGSRTSAWGPQRGRLARGWARIGAAALTRERSKPLSRAAPRAGRPGKHETTGHRARTSAWGPQRGRLAHSWARIGAAPLTPERSKPV